MLNNRTLYPPLFKPVGNGGGGSGQTIQVTELPEAVLSEKDKIYQYTGSTTETLTNGFFYKCVENTSYDWEETEASETYTEAEVLPTASAETVGTIYKVDDKYYQTVIVLTYSWVNIPVMEVEGGGINVETTETEVGTFCGKPLFAIAFDDYQLPSNTQGGILADFTGKQFVFAVGCAKQESYQQYYSLGGMSTSNALSIYQDKGNGMLYVNSGSNLFNNGKLYAIVYYLKTN